MRRLYRHTSTLSLSYAVPIFHLARSATQTSLLPSKAALAAPPAAPAAAPAAPLPALPKHPLVGVHNFRDVGTSVQGVRQQFVFRSGAPLKGSQEDLQYLVGACKVRTMIDLRSDRERELDDERNHVHLHFPAKYDFSQQRPAGDESRRYHTVHLTGAHFVMRLLWESPFTTSVKAIGYAVRGAPEKATLELITSLNGRGLLNLYRMFLDCSQSQICQVIHLFSSPENYPIHYFCSLGKDRTGIITALVLCCCDVDREHICNDYSRSREDVALTGDMKAAMKDTGLSDEFLDSPKEVMHATLAYLDAEFGSPKQYLEKIGVPRATQDKIKAILAQPPSLTNVAMPLPPAETLPSAVEVGAVAPGEIPHHLRAKKAQSTPELYDSAKKERKEKETRQERHERHERERQEKKERRQSRSPPPKLERVAQSTSNLVEVIDDAEVERQAKAQVYVWDPKAHQLNKEKESSKP